MKKINSGGPMASPDQKRGFSVQASPSAKGNGVKARAPKAKEKVGAKEKEKESME